MYVWVWWALRLQRITSLRLVQHPLDCYYPLSGVAWKTSKQIPICRTDWFGRKRNPHFCPSWSEVGVCNIRQVVGKCFLKFCPTWAELFFRRQLKFVIWNSEYSERTFLRRVAESTAHVNGQDERASPAVDKFAHLRCVAIKGQQQKVLPPLLTKFTITALTGNSHFLYNNAVEILSTHT